MIARRLSSRLAVGVGLTVHKGKPAPVLIVKEAACYNTADKTDKASSG